MPYMPQYYYPRLELKKSPEVVKIVQEIQVDQKKSLEICVQAAPSEPDPEKIDKILNLCKEMCEVKIPYCDPDNMVMYDGDPDSPVMFIGEAPGEQEVIQKKPFVGKSGKLLQEMFDHAGICRKNIYVTNAVIWRPPNNQTPLPAEIGLMRPYIIRHIEIIQPKIIVLVGGVAYRCVMNEVIAISKIRGKWQARDFCPNIINIFHPSYLLRSPIHRRETWHDILSIRRKIIDLGHEKYVENGSLSLG